LKVLCCDVDDEPDAYIVLLAPKKKFLLTAIPFAFPAKDELTWLSIIIPFKPFAIFLSKFTDELI
jgi:hypothetical protein